MPKSVPNHILSNVRGVLWQATLDNMHLHGHLKECILDFGPVYTFWLFSFERLNGVLGFYHTNRHDISAANATVFIQRSI